MLMIVAHEESKLVDKLFEVFRREFPKAETKQYEIKAILACKIRMASDYLNASLKIDAADQGASDWPPITSKDAMAWTKVLGQIQPDAALPSGLVLAMEADVEDVNSVDEVRVRVRVRVRVEDVNPVDEVPSVLLYLD